jgi:diguanylate cyclase (GGDEF)-like protein/PAS domain S-box-containing protein
MQLDGELRNVHASKAALALVGLPAEEFVGRTYGEAGLPPEVVDPLERELRAAVASGREREIELEMPTSEGPRWLHLLLVPAGADAPNPGSVTLTATDITASRQAELRLSAGDAAFRALVEDSPDPIALIDAELRVAFVNDALVRTSGRAASTILGGTIGEAGLFLAEIAERLEEAITTVLSTGERLAIDFRTTTSADGPRWFSGRLLPELDADRRCQRVILTCTDVTERVNREAEQAALRRVATVVAREADLEEIGRVVAQEVALLLNASGSAVYRFESIDLATCIAAHPPAEPETEGASTVVLTATTATGRTARTGKATRVDDYRGAQYDHSVREVLKAGLRSGIASPLWARGALWGALTAGSSRASGFGPAEERRLAAFAELAAIAVANAETREELDRLVGTDPLTGLANRRALTARLGGEVERARRHGHSLSLAILDLDDFKMVNDTLGHQVGDAVLAEVGRRLTANCRAGELVARMGGEEFAWILPQVDAMGSVVVVERARAAISQIDVEGARGITCSAGICDISVARDLVELLRLADRALYVAKGSGRDRVEIAR